MGKVWFGKFGCSVEVKSQVAEEAVRRETSPFCLRQSHVKSRRLMGVVGVVQSCTADDM